MRKIFTYLLSLWCLLAASTVLASPSDCVQLAADGQVNCFKAISKFKAAVSNRPEYDTFEEAAQAEAPIMCGVYPHMVCYIQWENNPPYPPASAPKCGDVNHCNGFTYVDYNTSKSASGRVFITYYSPTGKAHVQWNMIIHHLRRCPIHTTAVAAGPDTYLVYCKPSNGVSYPPAPCDDNSCLSNTGAASAGN